MSGWRPFQSSTYQNLSRVANPFHPIYKSVLAQKVSQEQMIAALHAAILVPSQCYSPRRYNHERATHLDNLQWGCLSS